MAELRGITVKVPADLHDKVKAEQELLQQDGSITAITEPWRFRCRRNSFSG